MATKSLTGFLPKFCGDMFIIEQMKGKKEEMVIERKVGEDRTNCEIT